MSADGKYINAMLLALPEKQVVIKQVKPVEGSAIRMYGLDTDLKWSWDEANGLTIELPDPAALPCKYVWVLKIGGKEI